MDASLHTPDTTASLARLTQAPHRLMFFIGATNVLAAMAWWAAWLCHARWPHGAWQPPAIYAGWLHAFVMQYQMLPSFIFGFLLTVFARWMNLPSVEPWRYLPVGLGVFGGQLATLLGAVGWEAGLVVGPFMTLAGWLAALATLGPLLAQEKGITWHARVCFAALCLGAVGLLAWIAFVLGASPWWAHASIKLGSFGLLLPVYFAVAHRMFPFFAGNIVPGYRPWRPLWVLGAMLALCLLHLAFELAHAYAWLWLADVPLLALSAMLCWRWWPRARVPGLLQVLFLGLAWLPIAFALYSWQSAAYALTDMFPLGRAPAHALFVGFFGSVLVAMVTRVTQGHSGRELVMPGVAWFAYLVIQLVAILRVAAELGRDSAFWHAIAALGWLVAMAPWIARIGRIYLSPRADGKSG